MDDDGLVVLVVLAVLALVGVILWRKGVLAPAPAPAPAKSPYPLPANLGRGEQGPAAPQGGGLNFTSVCSKFHTTVGGVIGSTPNPGVAAAGNAAVVAGPAFCNVVSTVADKTWDGVKSVAKKLWPF